MSPASGEDYRSSDTYFKNEVSKLKEMFFLNGYPRSFFDRAFQNFMDRLSRDCTPTVEEDSEDIKKVNLTVPYLGEPSRKFAKQMKSLFKSTYNVKLQPVFTTTKIGDYFSLKDRTPFPYSANVVYQFHCLRDAGCTYIGQTKRHLLTRVKEHLSPLKQSGPKSEVRTHINRCPSCHKNFLGIDNFKVLKKCQNSYETVIHEALTIKRFQPKLNKQLMKAGASYLLKVF